MNKGNIFWGLVLIVFGGLFLLQNQGLIGNVFVFFWPVVLMLLGGWIILNVFWKSDAMGETFSVPLNGAKRVSYKFNHGAAQINIRGAAPAGMALVGSAGAAGEHKSQLSDDKLEVSVGTGPSFIPFLGPDGGMWRYQISSEVPVALVVEAGASTFDIDLQDTLTERVDLRIGASTVNVTMPARGASELSIEGGAATFTVCIPDGVAARINTVEGFVALNVAERFLQAESGLYASPDFDSATNRVLITVRAGVGSVNVK
jgi:hypothetical protein